MFYDLLSGDDTIPITQASTAGLQVWSSLACMSHVVDLP